MPVRRFSMAVRCRPAVGSPLERPASSLPDDGHYARNLIGGRWQFPAAPYEFEIRHPGDSTITAVVPLSSRFDVDRAFGAAAAALRGPWAGPAERIGMLQAVIDLLEASRTELARLQSTETGLSMPDSLDTLGATVSAAKAVLGTVGTWQRVYFGKRVRKYRN
jgi:acyl-CoA reductase-like NAD-dependent aldehyde dehydrogenase